MSSPSAAPDALAPAREAPARAEDGDRGSDPQKVLADRVEQLYSQMPLGIVFTLVIGAIATYELWDNRTRELVMFWWGLVLLVTAARVKFIQALEERFAQSFTPEESAAPTTYRQHFDHQARRLRDLVTGAAARYRPHRLHA